MAGGDSVSHFYFSQYMGGDALSPEQIEMIGAFFGAVHQCLHIARGHDMILSFCQTAVALLR